MTGSIVPEFQISPMRLKENSLTVDRGYLDATLFVLPCNDGEALRACQILQGLETPHVFVSQQKWGATLDRDWQKVESLMLETSGLKRLCIFEMPGLPRSLPSQVPVEEQILARGLELDIIDHHHYDWIDRHHTLSSLEQFCQKIGWKMDAVDMQIAVNDRSYIPGLQQLGITPEQVRRIRQFDLEAQGKKPEYIKRHLASAKKLIPKLAALRDGDLWIVQNVKVDRVILMQEITLQAGHGQIDIAEIKDKRLGFSGNVDVVKALLKTDFGQLGLQPGFANYGGGDLKTSGFWGLKLGGSQVVSRQIAEEFLKIVRELRDRFRKDSQ